MSYILNITPFQSLHFLIIVLPANKYFKRGKEIWLGALKLTGCAHIMERILSLCIIWLLLVVVGSDDEVNYKWGASLMRHRVESTCNNNARTTSFRILLYARRYDIILFAFCSPVMFANNALIWRVVCSNISFRKKFIYIKATNMREQIYIWQCEINEMFRRIDKQRVSNTYFVAEIKMQTYHFDCHQ